jgi:threonine dehydrogenase-like Zn-dependent dehydrogenase
MVTHNMAFDDVQKAYDMYEKYEDNMVKVLLKL